MIRTIYHGHEPDFPATLQHPDAQRYYVVGDQVLSKTDYAAHCAIAELGALIAVYGTAEQPAIDAFVTQNAERRGSLKAQLEAERQKRMPVLTYAVDATGEPPTRDAIDAVLNPPA